MSKIDKVFLVAGLGFGDEGKGTTTEFLCRRNSASLVVRYNGGPQTAHNIVTIDGRHHTFAQFGSGSLDGVPTYLSRFMLVEPLSFMKEGAHLKSLGVRDIYSKVYVDENALVVTPYHWLVNRLQEDRRLIKHGSCGRGIGECRSQYLKYGEGVLHVRDLLDPVLLREKLKFHAMQAVLKIGVSNLEVLNFDLDAVVNQYRLFTDSVEIVKSDFLKTARGTVVFEGAQGVLLDETWGFQPHTTWTDITFQNAETLLKEAKCDVQPMRIGVLRTYSTRHGAGPFVASDPAYPVSKELFNHDTGFQGKFRTGPFDCVMTRYALDVIGGVDGFAVTHFDAPGRWKAIRSYRTPVLTKPVEFFPVHRPCTFEGQESLREVLEHSLPAEITEFSVTSMEFMFSTPVVIQSRGPTFEDKEWYT